MRKWITFLMTLLVGSTVSYANATTGQVTLEAGFRQDNLSWKNRFPSSDPIFKTSSNFRDIDIFQIGLRGSTTLGCNLYLRGQAYWGWVLDGKTTQSVSLFPSFYGFSDVNAGLEFGTDRNRIVDEKYVYGVGAAIGYPFYFCDCTMMVAPVIGYAVDEQNLWVEDEGFSFGSDSGIFFVESGGCCCNNKTIFKWFGPFVGFDFNYRPYCECWNLWAEVEYHWGSFIGKRDYRGLDVWSNNEQRHHSNNASAWVFAIGADYEFCSCWTLGLSAKFQDWSASKSKRERFSGYDEYFFGSGGHSRHTNKWNSYAVNVTVGRHFQLILLS